MKSDCKTCLWNGRVLSKGPISKINLFFTNIVLLYILACFMKFRFPNWGTIFRNMLHEWIWLYVYFWNQEIVKWWMVLKFNIFYFFYPTKFKKLVSFENLLKTCLDGTLSTIGAVLFRAAIPAYSNFTWILRSCLEHFLVLNVFLSPILSHIG